jgi:hypothetical protein
MDVWSNILISSGGTFVFNPPSSQGRNELKVKPKKIDEKSPSKIVKTWRKRRSWIRSLSMNLQFRTNGTFFPCFQLVEMDKIILSLTHSLPPSHTQIHTHTFSLSLSHSFKKTGKLRMEGVGLAVSNCFLGSRSGLCGRVHRVEQL